MKSMTAYSHILKTKGQQTVRVVFRSTNFKYLTIAVHNLTPENIVLEEAIKKEIKKKINRGKIEAYVFLRGPLASKIRIDEKLLARYVAQAKRLAGKYKLRPDAGIRDFLNLPQVIRLEEEHQDGGSLILGTAREALQKLLDFKKKQGKIIKQDMCRNLKRLKTNAAKIKKKKPKVTKEDNSKEDIDEEASLISFYTNKLERIIYSQKTASQGKAIDFLTQELLRELNAASSKTKHTSLASLIVEAKGYLERIREQAQNIE